MMKKRKFLFLTGILCGTLALGGWTFFAKDMGSTNSKEVIITDEAVPLANSPAKVLVPSAPGTTVYQEKNVAMDASNTNQGYVMIKYSGQNQKIKVQIVKSSGTTYTYNLNARNAYETFPLTDGNGTYSIKVFENISGTKYSQAFSKSISVKLANPYLPFLYPNQYVNFNAGSNTVKIGAQITKSTSDDLKKVELIYDYTVGHLTYDKAKAASVQTGYLPDVDAVLASKKGICFDYASVMATMLRSQNIPCKLVVGYTGSLYHAWINVYTPETGWVDGMIFFDGKKWQLMDPTLASSSKKSESVMKYIGDSNNYTAKYIY
ncbi:transglutaminase-like domain-containing protein [Aminipila luticellarii]|uniref:Transglutaminase domain-containing protein n=1 Tax=Aminipila luticellarii TaxID=2507160 RepID=A0A410PTB3_9FIRM|nr:transglutaminase domain-containing protein [Aminipila luticellarii]QAT42126.1 transglutaminase domain-containing protein [Aminipila luticellarii]